MDWEESDKRNENEVIQKRECEVATKLMTLSLFIPTLRDSFSFCFVTSEGLLHEPLALLSNKHRTRPLLRK